MAGPSAFPWPNKRRIQKNHIAKIGSECGKKCRRTRKGKLLIGNFPGRKPRKAIGRKQIKCKLTTRHEARKADERGRESKNGAQRVTQFEKADLRPKMNAKSLCVDRRKLRSATGCLRVGGLKKMFQGNGEKKVKRPKKQGKKFLSKEMSERGKSFESKRNRAWTNSMKKIFSR